MSERKKTRVLVVDDSATTRRLLSRHLQAQHDIEVVGEASNAFTAQELIRHHDPDVITLDIEMPQVDGLAFLRQLMKHHPIPVIVISSHTPAGSVLSLEALRAGAVDVIPKPRGPDSVTNIAGRLKQRIRELRANPIRLRALPERHHLARRSTALMRRKLPVQGVIAVGTSTGGPQALELLLTQLPANTPPIVIVQHMPVPFTRFFAERLNEICPMEVVEAAHGQELTSGVAYVAPGDRHLSIEQEAGRLRTATRKGPLVNHQRPAVDVLFHSLAKVRGLPIVGVLLTGMGKDGADGMVALRRAGHATIAEDSRSCVVFGMPREAIARGGAAHVLPLEDIPAMIFGCLQRATEAQQTSS